MTSAVSVGLTRDSFHRYRWGSGPLVPGVTSIIKMLDKSGPLIGWAKRETAACAIRNLPMLATMVETGGPDAAATWLSRIPDFQRDTAADLGSRVHTLAEAIARGQEVVVEPDAAPRVASYLRWREAAKPRFVNVEFMVYSERHGYGGTADAVLELDGELWLVDYKTSKGLYGETALQLAGYARADWAGVPGNSKKFRIPRVTRYGVLHIRDDAAELVPYAVGEDEWEAFLACRRLLRWTQERQPHVKQPVAELVRVA